MKIFGTIKMSRATGRTIEVYELSCGCVRILREYDQDGETSCLYMPERTCAVYKEIDRHYDGQMRMDLLARHREEGMR